MSFLGYALPPAAPLLVQTVACFTLYEACIRKYPDNRTVCISCGLENNIYYARIDINNNAYSKDHQSEKAKVYALPFFQINIAHMGLIHTQKIQA